jgi:hypothetical protein
MTNKQNSHLRMYLAVIKVCDANTAAFATLVAFVNVYTKFKELVAKINVANTALQGKKTGITEDKMRNRQAMCAATLPISGALVAYANAIGNHELANEADVSETSILECKENDADDICLHIYDLGKANLSNLADYGINQALLDEQAATIADFTEKIGKPRAHVINTKTVRANMNSYFKEANSLLEKQLDNLILVVKPKNKDLYEAYQAARNVIDLGGGKTETPKGE